MKLPRLLAAAGAAALVALVTAGAGPAFVAVPGVTISTPGSDANQNTLPVNISGSISQGGSGGTVTSVSVSLTSDDGWTTENSTQTYSGSAVGVFSGGGGNVSFNWPVSPKYNGRYTIGLSGSGKTTGLGGGNTGTSTASQSFNVRVPPATATGVTVGMDEPTMQVTVSWTANKEPDIEGYEVLRSYAGGSSKPIASVGASSHPTYTENLSSVPAGQYKYQVIAERFARQCKTASQDSSCNGADSVPAAQASAFSAAVTVRGVPVTTTSTTSTTIKKGGGSTGGGSTGGGSTGGGSTGGGSTGGGSAGGTKTTALTGKAAPKNSGGFAPGGEVDLSQFGALLNGTSKSGTKTTTPEADGTYDPTLKYDVNGNPIQAPKNNDSLITIGGADIPRPSDDWVRFIGAGSLMTALLVHVLWFKQQVDRVPLEAIVE